MSTVQGSQKSSVDSRNHCIETSTPCEKKKLLELLTESESDLKSRNVASLSDTFHDLRTLLMKNLH